MAKKKSGISDVIGRIVPGESNSPSRKKPAKKKGSGGGKRGGGGGKKSGGRKKRKKTSSRKWRIFVWLVKIAAVLVATAFIAGFLIIALYAHDLPDINDLYNDDLKKSVTVLDKNGQVIATYGDLFSEFVQYKDIPKTLIDAVIATEDRRFFSHSGIDPRGLLRAAVINTVSGRVSQGGSTITQQLAKIVFLKPERRMKRKIQEAILAVWLEHKFSKEQIMAMYLNRVYLGSGVYGIDSAAHRYFGKPAKNLSLYESALIAGLLKAPTTYSPYNSPKASVNRTRQVLANMVDARKITEYERNRAIMAATKIKIHERRESGKYFADYVVDLVQQYSGEVQENIIVKTTLDYELQKLADDSITQNMMARGAELSASQAAMVVMRPDGAVLAMIGGVDYSESQFNRATQAKRQPGSLFKLFVYLAALENGFNPETIIDDVPVSIGKWRPTNYDEQYHGPVMLREAFSKSLNAATVKLSLDVGRGKIINLARQMGIKSKLADMPSIALGSSEVNLLEITAAYAHLANKGAAVSPYAINEIRTTHGNVLYKRKGDYDLQVISLKEVKKMNNLLLSVIRSGTGRAAQIGRDAAGKTGTSQDFRDAWFVGYTPQLVAGVWIGNDDNKPMKKVTGGNLPAKIWADFMKPALAGKPALAIDENYDTGFGGEIKGFWESLIGD